MDPLRILIPLDLITCTATLGHNLTLTRCVVSDRRLCQQCFTPSLTILRFASQPLGGMLFLSFLPPSSYYQASPLSFSEVCSTLQAIARLHASAWEDVPLLTSLRNSTGIAGSYTLPNRNPIELDRVGKNWRKYITEFESVDPSFCCKPEIVNLGDRVQAIAKWISSQLSCTPTTPMATIQHGDFKAMNVFLPKDDGESAVLIDFASTGVGECGSSIPQLRGSSSSPAAVLVFLSSVI